VVNFFIFYSFFLSEIRLFRITEEYFYLFVLGKVFILERIHHYIHIKEVVEMEKKADVKFIDCMKVGDNIDALVKHFTGNILGEFILEQALNKVKDNDKKLKEYKDKLLNSEAYEGVE